MTDGQEVTAWNRITATNKTGAAASSVSAIASDKNGKLEIRKRVPILPI